MKGILVVVVALLAGALGGYVAGRVGQDEEVVPQSDIVETGSAEVVRTDLIQTEVLAGELRFSDQARLLSQRAGTVTFVPIEGATLDIGDTAYEVDGVAVEIMQGDRPAWRPFAAGMDDGTDILQLEQNLVDLGYETGRVDQTFDEETVAAVEAWQSDRGHPENGAIPLGWIAFVEDGFRVGETLSDRGSFITMGSPVYRTSSFAQEVVIELDPRDLDLVQTGAAVTVTMPDGDEVPGEISDIALVVRRLGGDPDAPEVIDVIVAVNATGIDLERAPVEVTVESDRASSVLAVPVRALVTLSDGGYAVEVVDGAQTKLVGVNIGDFAAGLVEIEGPVSEGDTVVIPVG